MVLQDLEKHDSKIAHLKAEKKALISKRTESQKEINQTKLRLANLHKTQLKGKKGKATRNKIASLEQSLKIQGGP